MHRQPAHSAHWLPIVITFRGGHCRAKPCIRVLKLRFQLIWVSWRKLEKNMLLVMFTFPSRTTALTITDWRHLEFKMIREQWGKKIRRKIGILGKKTHKRRQSIGISPRPEGALQDQLAGCWEGISILKSVLGSVYYLPDEVRARAWTFPENVLRVNCREKERITHFKVRWAVKVTGVPRGIFRQRRLGHNSKFRVYNMKTAQYDLFFSVFLPLQSLV